MKISFDKKIKKTKNNQTYSFCFINQKYFAYPISQYNISIGSINNMNIISLIGHSSFINVIKKRKNFLFSGSDDFKILIWDCKKILKNILNKNNKKILPIKIIKAPHKVFNIFIINDRHLLCFCFDIILAIDYISEQIIKSLKNCDFGSQYSYIIISNTKVMCSNSCSNILYEIDFQKKLKITNKHKNMGKNGVEWFNKEKNIIITHENKKCILYNINIKKKIMELKYNNKSEIRKILRICNGKYIIIASKDGSIVFLNKKCEFIKQFYCHTNWICGLIKNINEIKTDCEIKFVSYSKNEIIFWKIIEKIDYMFEKKSNDFCNIKIFFLF